MTGWGTALTAEMNAQLAARQAEPPEPPTRSESLAALCERADVEGWEVNGRGGVR